MIAFVIHIVSPQNDRNVWLKKKAKLEETSWMDQQTWEIQECIEKKIIKTGGLYNLIKENQS